MDSQAAENLLMEFFKENSYYEPSEHFEKLVLITENTSADSAAVGIALDRFEAAEIIKSKEVDGKTYHVLSRPIDSWEQQVEINYGTAIAIRTCVNEFCDLIQDHKDKCDSTQITTKDIYNLTLICEHYKNMIENS